MPYKIVLNNKIIMEGDLKSLSVVFNSLSGLSFAKSKQSNWLNKMTARASYSHYLKIMSHELKVDIWQGQMMLLDEHEAPEKAHIFDEKLSDIQDSEEDNSIASGY